MARALWKGELKLGDVRVPVKLVSARAPESTFDVGFHFAHRCSKKTLTRINKKTWCATCQKHVDDTVRVIEYANGKHVEVDGAGLKACEATDNGLLEVIAHAGAPFEPNEIGSVMYLLPDGPAAVKTFRALRVSIDELDDLVGKVTISKRTHYIAIRSDVSGGACVAFELLPRDRVRGVADVLEHAPEFVLNEDLVPVRRQLRALPKRFDRKQLVDDYQQRVRELVKTKTASLINPARKRRAS